MSLSRPSANVSRTLIRAKCRDFADFQVWPFSPRLDPGAWLRNFDDADQDVAHHLLNSFMYFSTGLTVQLFLVAIQNLSTLPEWRENRTGDPFAEWAAFLRGIMVTHVIGDHDNNAGSGSYFTRLARDRAGVQDSQIVDMARALHSRVIKGNRSPLVIVDDFMGSGEQFLDTWNRRFPIGPDRLSLSDVVQHAKLSGDPWEIYFVPAVSTETSIARLGIECPDVIVSAGNVLDPKYSLFHPDSLLWPSGVAAQGRETIERVSLRLNLLSNGDRLDYRGFRKLGLALAFEHKTPDATIPIFRYEGNGWKPLVKG